MAQDKTQKFIPQVWSARILAALQKEMVYSQLFNRDYEGEISDAGDTVHIGMVSAPTIKDFECDTDIDAPETVNVSDQLLTIDQQKYFNVGVCDIYQVQSAVNLLDSATSQTGYGFADVADQYLAGLLKKTGTATEGLGTDAAPIAVTTQNAYAQLVHMKTALDKANCPKQGRLVVVPPEFEGIMLLDPQRFAQVDTGSEQVTYPGAVYRAAGFTVLVSNNVPTTEAVTGQNPKPETFALIASVPQQGTYAEQIVKTEAYRPERRFGDAVKGLHVYGAKVLRPEIVAVNVVNF